MRDAVTKGNRDSFLYNRRFLFLYGGWWQSHLGFHAIKNYHSNDPSTPTHLVFLNMKYLNDPLTSGAPTAQKRATKPRPI